MSATDPHLPHGGPQAGVDCSQVVLRVFEYIDKETDESDSARIKAHLDGCAHCLDEYERDVLLKAIVRRSCSGASAPGALRSAILARLTSVTVTSTDGQSRTTTRHESVHVRRSEGAEQVSSQSAPQRDRPR